MHRHQGPRSLVVLAVVLMPLAACDAGREDAALQPRRGGSARTAPLDSLIRDDGQWVMAAKDYASTRFSGLGQITTQNVRNLRLAWSFSTGQLRGHEAAPLVVNNTMYVVTPFPNVLFALDLTRNGALAWKFEPNPNPAAQGVACCDVVNRGAAYGDGKIFINTLDGQTVAVNAETGKEVWRARLGDVNKGETVTMAPLVVKNKVLVGNSGGEMGVRGWLTALDIATGKIAWRAYSTGPDSEVLIGPQFRPFYPQYRGADLGVSSWPPGQWKIGGSNVWGWISYDPALDLIYYGTGNPGVWNPALREGDNLWSTTLFARDPDDGSARWAYQFSPHDNYDYDAVLENVLLDLPVNGRTRKVLVRPARNGFVYLIDRTTGEVLSADPFGKVNWASGIDLATGRPRVNPEKATDNRLARNVCPASPGMKDWQPSAYSPRTGLLYIPMNNLCMDYRGTQVSYISGTPYVGAEVVMYSADSGANPKNATAGSRGQFTAWDPVGRRIVWQLKERFPVWSGAVATAGDVVFYGTMDRWFKAVDARTGKLLWQYQVGSGIVGQPITYRGPDGKQYVAVLSGVGGWAGITALGAKPEKDPTIALGFATAMQDLPQYTAQGGMLYVFALP